MRIRLPFSLLLVLLVWAGPTSAVSSGLPQSALTDQACEIESIGFRVNGAASGLIEARRGDEVTVSFTVPDGCENDITFASYVAPDPAFDGSRLDAQALFAKDRARLGPGRHSLTIEVYSFPGDDGLDCSASPAVWGTAGEELRDEVKAKMVTSAEYRAQVIEAVKAKRAVDRSIASAAPKDRACATAASPSGGPPCAGCKGNADDKEPPGQDPEGTDGNKGHECDLNPGIGDGNPAHSPCRNFQLDLAYSGLDPALGGDPTRTRRLIAGVFCVGTTDLCYAIDRTGTSAVFHG